MTWIVSQRRILFEQKILKRSRRKKKVVSKEFDAFYGKQLFFGGPFSENRGKTGFDFSTINYRAVSDRLFK